ncbi:30S ribosomal protein S5, partial [Nanoarchaeota archaeon]
KQEKEKIEEKRLVDEPIDEEKVKAMEAIEEKEREEELQREKEAGLTFKEKRALRNEEREKLARIEALENWKPKTKLGMLVRAGKIKDIDEIFEKGYKIVEPQVVDKLLPNLKNELLLLGQSKGKFGGGKRRFWKQTQKKTSEGNVPHFSCLAIVGDQNGHIGFGVGKAKETLPAKEKALRIAKLSLTPIKRGCGSFDCTCTEKHSIPFMIQGKRGSALIKLMPAPKGTGLVIEKECKKILKLAGIKDIYSKTFGQSRTKMNLAGACFNSLKNALRMRE